VVTAGTVNPITRKQYLDDRYRARTVRHSNAVLRSFYDFWIDAGGGPLINPVRRGRGRGGRPNAHHNPLEMFRSDGRLIYNPKIAKRQPRAMPDDQWLDLFAALGSDRDRAILALAISNGARAAEVLGIRGVDLDWGEQLVRVTRKGSRAEQWLPASSEAFVWIRLYLDGLGQLNLNRPLW
jgi:integrase/recombinase XerD